MNITFTDDRDLGELGTVSRGEIRSDLPDDVAAAIVHNGWATAAEVDEVPDPPADTKDQDATPKGGNKQ